MFVPEISLSVHCSQGYTYVRKVEAAGFYYLHVSCQLSFIKLFRAGGGEMA
jgi:hypothetical protein